MQRKKLSPAALAQPYLAIASTQNLYCQLGEIASADSELRNKALASEQKGTHSWDE